MPRSPDSSAGRRVQYAALPYRQRQDGEVQVRLITSRETRRWVLPKGWPMKDIAPHKAAAREAFEEAGLIGSTSRTAIGLYTYEKRLSPIRSVTCDVLVFPMKVKRYLKKWPERSQRIGFWFTVESAAAAVQEEDLKDLILRFGAIMADRYAAKQAEKQAKALEAQALQQDGAAAKDSPAKGAPAKGAPAKGVRAKGVRAKGVRAKGVQAKDAEGSNPLDAKNASDAKGSPGGKGSKAGGKGQLKVTSMKLAPEAAADPEMPALDRDAKGKAGKRKGVVIKVREKEASEPLGMPAPHPTTH